MKPFISSRFLVALPVVLGCGYYEDEPEVAEDQPVAHALSTDRIRVGEPLSILGEGFLADEAGHTEIAFDGVYRTNGGQRHAVALRVRPHSISGTEVVWAYFGPYRIPFSPRGDELGTFEGTVTAINMTRDGREVSSAPVDASLRVEPSLVVRALEPRDGRCSQPATRLRGGVPYRLEVEAVGFQPVEFTYEVLGATSTVVRREASGPIAVFGEDEEIAMAPVAGDQSFHVARFRIAARSRDGELLTSEYTVGVHRPVEYVDWDSPQIAEIDGAEPVTGCIAGGINGSSVSYEETVSTLLARLVSVNWSEAWIQETPTAPEDAIALAAPALQHRASGREIGREAEEWTVGHDYGVADTESVAHLPGWSSNGVSSSGDDFWSVSSADALSGVEGEIIPNMFGVWYRQSTRIVRPGGIVAWDQCGEPTLVGESLFHDFSWAASLAQSDECPPFPESTMPEPQCLIPPCAGE